MNSSDIPPTQKGVSRGVLSTGSWLLSQEGVNLVLTLFFSVIALRKLGPEIFGLVTLTQSVLTLSNLGTLNLEQAIIRYVPTFSGTAGGSNGNRVILLGAGIKIYLSLIIAVLLYFAAPLIANSYLQPVLLPAIRVGAVSFVFAALAEVGAAACLGLLRPQIRTYIAVIRRSVEILGILLLPTANIQVSDVIWVLAIANIFAGIGYTLATLLVMSKSASGNPGQSNRATLSMMFSYSMPIMGAHITKIGGQEAGKLLLAQFASPAVLGYYSVARLAADRLMTLFAQPPLAAVPVLAKDQADHPENGTEATNRAILRLVKYQTIAGAFAGLMLVITAPMIIAILAGGAYTPAVPAMRIVGVIIVFWAGGGTLHTLFLVEQKPIGIFYQNLSTIVGALTFYWVLTPRFGAAGTALADGLGQFAALMVGLFIVQRWFSFEAKKSISDTVKIITPAFLLGILFPQSVTHSVLLLLGAIVAAFIYGSYLLAANQIDASVWEFISKTNLRFSPLNRLKTFATSFLKNYQKLLRQPFKN